MVNQKVVNFYFESCVEECFNFFFDLRQVWKFMILSYISNLENRNMKTQGISPSQKKQFSPEIIEKENKASMFKIDFPNIRKNPLGSNDQNSNSIADRFSKVQSERISSLLKLLKKSKSNTKILVNSPYCNFPYKSQIISYIKDKEQKSMHSRRSRGDEQPCRFSFKTTFIVQFPTKPSLTVKAKNFDRFLIDAETCIEDGLISFQKIKKQLSEIVEGGEKKYLLKKIFGFSCVGLSNQNPLKKSSVEGLDGYRIKHGQPSGCQKGDDDQIKKLKQQSNSKLESLQQTVSYLLSIGKLSLSAPQLKEVKSITLSPLLVPNISSIDKKSSAATLSDFTMIKCLGSGGFSTVFLAKCLKNNKYYAMKLIQKDFILETQREAIVSNERFILEKIMSPANPETQKPSLKHQFVTEMSFCFETYNHFIFALEFCPGGELFHQLKKVKKMTEEEAKFYFLEILMALDHVHSHGVVYRDLKPQNLLIDAEGHIKIADFGLSKPLNSKKQMSYSFCGSPEYMAPEMLCKTGHNYLLDYYCLGALLYELVTGIPPYYSLDQDEIYHSIMTEELSFPYNIPLSPEIKNLLEGLLNKDMKKRLGSLCGINQIFFHPWVGKTNRSQIQNRLLVPPFLPNLMEANFDVDDIKSDLEKINKKLEEDKAIGNDFESIFTQEFHYQSQKQMQQATNQGKDQQQIGISSRNTDLGRNLTGWKKNSNSSYQEQAEHKSYHENRKNLNPKYSTKKSQNSKRSVIQRLQEHSQRYPELSEKKYKNKMCKSTRRFTSQQPSMDRKLLSKPKNKKVKLPYDVKVIIQTKSLMREKSSANISQNKIIRNKRQVRAVLNQINEKIFNKNTSIEAIKTKQYKNNDVLYEVMKQNSLANLGYKDQVKIESIRNHIGYPKKSTKMTRNIRV